jgi:hypothetical protein
MSPLPVQMADHWWQRPGRQPGRELYHWHILFHDQPKVRELMESAQERLAGLRDFRSSANPVAAFDHLHRRFADEVPENNVEAVISEARRLLTRIPPIPVTLGRIFYHPEAVTLPVEPVGASIRSSKPSARRQSQQVVSAIPTRIPGARISRSPTATVSRPRLPSSPRLAASFHRSRLRSDQSVWWRKSRWKGHGNGEQWPRCHSRESRFWYTLASGTTDASARRRAHAAACAVDHVDHRQTGQPLGSGDDVHADDFRRP